MTSFMKSIKILAVASLIPVLAQAQQQQPETTSQSSYMSNGLFLVMAVVIFILLLVIVGLAEVVKAAATHQRRREKGDGNGKILSAILVLALAGTQLNAQDAVVPPAEAVTPPFDYWGLGAQMFWVLLVCIMFELIIIIMLYRTAMNLLRVEAVKSGKPAPAFTESSLMKSITGSQTPEEEAAIMMDHEYDGIRELDNNLPLWWKYGFYVTIIVAVIYLFNYHVLETGLSSKEEFEKEVAEGDAEVAEYKKNNAQEVDESTVVMLIDAASLGAGKSIYTENCAPCHAAEGQGLVGPNLTDDYWLHKGGIADVFKSIKYGWADKGMKSWEKDLNALEMQQVASYILSLRGTNPPNPKAKEGELYVTEGGAAGTADSLAVDSVSSGDTSKLK
jgi:cytochrome c oxidase cbb3-type subunit 3